MSGHISSPLRIMHLSYCHPPNDSHFDDAHLSHGCPMAKVGGWEKLETIRFLDGKIVFEILER